MPTTPNTSFTLTGWIAVAWGIGGFTLLILAAIIKLAAMSIEAFRSPFQYWHWILLIANTVFMAYSEGYKGFQQHYAPRLAARASYLLKTRSPLEILFAPLFCMSYFNAPRRRIIVSVILTIAIILLVIIFRMLPQPLRGILDAGVVVGLSWGLISTVYYCFNALTNPAFAVDPEIPYPNYPLQTNYAPAGNTTT